MYSAPPQPPLKTADGFNFVATADDKDASGPYHCAFVKGASLNGLYLKNIWVCTPAGQ